VRRVLLVTPPQKRNGIMARYLFQATYTSDAWAAQVHNPQNRVEVVRPVIERLGGRIESVYFAFGEYDVVGIVEMPDNVSMAAFSLAAAAGGAMKAIKTTPLMTIEEGIEAMRKASGTGYRPPGH
jgi:uncharacterized protein with GYD domain